MDTKRAILFPKMRDILEIMGENFKLARKRRRLTTLEVSERARINRSTLYKIEKGDPSVAIGHYMNVLRVFSLHEDFLLVGKDDVFGQKLRDIELLKGGR